MISNNSGRGDRAFIISMIMLILCLIFFLFSLYLLPFLFWKLNYDIPGFIFVWLEELKQAYNYTEKGAAAVIFLVFFIPSILLGYLSQLFATTLIIDESSGFEEQQDQEQATQQRRETLQFAFKLLLMILLVYIVLSLIEWLVAIPPPV